MVEKTIRLRIGKRLVSITGRHPEHLSAIRSRCSRFGGLLCRDPLVRIARDLPSGSLYLDIGANIGDTTVTVAACRPDISVIAFEPVPSNVSLLRRNVAANSLRNVSVVACAVGDAVESLGISDNGPWSAIGQGKDVVPVTTVEKWHTLFCPHSPVSFIKIDVEGYEPRVLAGSRRVIAEHRPLIFVEFNCFCLLLQGANPLEFARSLFSEFAVESPDGAHFATPEQVVHDCIVYYRGNFDIVLRPRA